MADDEDNGLVPKLIICLIAAASAAVAITLYHYCMTARHMQRWLPPPEVREEGRRRQQETSVSLENSVAELLPARKFRRSSDEGTCAICLGEFEEEEELRTLPGCSHSFHVACIDTWLHSHWNCPMCRSAVGELGSSLPTLTHLLHPPNLHNTSPIEIL